jgi:spoIIIJ-associated protein
MSETREFYGASVDRAVEKAAAEFGIDRDDLSFEVVDAGSGGFMGIGARDARVSVEVPASFSPPDTAEPADQAAPEDTHEVRDIEDVEEEVELETVPPAPPASEPSSVDEAVESDEPPVPEEVLEYVREFTSSAVEGMGINARIDVYDAGDFIAVDVASEQAGLFIGQKGETIDALQYLLNVATHKGHSVRKRAVLDSEGYRQRRIEALQGMAHRSARRAVRERRRIELPPMNPAERRVVHVYLQENDQVTTLSEGFGDERRVTVSPL